MLQEWKKPNGNKFRANQRKETEEYLKSIGCKKVNKRKAAK